MPMDPASELVPISGASSVILVLAYIDPGAGSILIQAILAGALAVPFFLRTQIQSVWGRLRRRGESESSQRSGPRR